MTEIPEDVMKAAMTVEDRLSINVDGPHRVKIIAKAIMAERERCEERMKVSIGKAMRLGFELGFMSTAEGFNGEYPFDGDDFGSVERLVKLREMVIEGREV